MTDAAVVGALVAPVVPREAATARNTAASSARLALDASAMGLREARASAVRLRGADPALGAAAHPAVCVEVTGASRRSARFRDPLDVVLIVDTSGSMSPAIDQLRLAVQQVFVELEDGDRIAVVAFEGFAKTLLKLTQKASVRDFDAVCKEIVPGGGTNIEYGLRHGFQALRHTARPPRVQSAWQPAPVAAAPRFAGRWSDVSEDEAEADSDGGDEPEPGSPTRALVLLLSDGEPNAGLRTEKDLCCMVQRLVARACHEVTFHTLGFTENHCVSLMSGLARDSGARNGNYYYLATNEDISAAVGDCLGSMAPVVCRNLGVKVDPIIARDSQVTAAGPWVLCASGENSPDTVPVLGLQETHVLSHAALRAGERQAFVLLLPAAASGCSVQLSWETDERPEEVHLSLSWLGDDATGADLQEVDLLSGDLPPHLPALRVITHVLRMKVGVALAALALAEVGNLDECRFDSLHDMLVGCLHLLQNFSAADDDSGAAGIIFLEGVLQALERDLGEAIADRRRCPERTGVLLSFAHEHLAMRSASSLTRCRVAYASSQQIEMRLRFLQSSGGTKHAHMKVDCQLAETGLTPEELDCREMFENHTHVLEDDGFVVPGAWRESVLGLGLFVHPRTLADRRKRMPPQVDLVVEYVSAEAYNRGVRTVVQHVDSESGSHPGDETQEEGTFACEPLRPAAVSRQRVNGWLPLYINDANWSTARTFAPSAFSLLATQLNTVFEPEDALKVCSRLMCCAVVGFVHPGRETGVPDHTRPPASHRAIQMYCDVHRLFLEMAREYPEIRSAAVRHLREFMAIPERRTRRGTPDLGNLIAYLGVVDEVTWADLAPTFVPEMVRRAFARFAEPFQEEQCDSAPELIARFDDLEPSHGLVILFNVAFNSLVARPRGPWSDPVPGPTGGGQRAAAAAPLPVEQVRAMYDARWGQLPPPRRQALLAEVERMRCLGSVSMVLQELLPFAFSDADVCELLLWGARHGHERGGIAVVPRLDDMQRPLTEAWSRKAARRRAVLAGLESRLAGGVPSPTAFSELLDDAVRLREEEESAAKAAVPASRHRFPSAAAASAAAAVARGLAEQRKAARRPASVVEGRGSRRAAHQEAPAPSAEGGPVQQDECAAAEVARRCPEPFDVRVQLLGAQEDSSFTLQGVTYGLPSQLTTGRDLRRLVAEHTGGDARKLHLTVRCGGDQDGTGTPVCNAKYLALTPLGKVAFAVLEVRDKQRGGRKLGKPGNGWHKSRTTGQTYMMGIAGAIVRETAFPAVQQYVLLVGSPSSVLEMVVGLAGILCSDAVVLSAQGGGRALERELLGVGAEPAGTSCVALGGRRLVLVEEEREEAEAAVAARAVDGAPAAAVSDDDGGAHDDDAGAPARGPEQVVSEVPVTYDVRVPPAAKGLGLVIVVGQPLKETASLAKTIWSMRGERTAPVRVFHVATNFRPVLLQTEEERERATQCLAEDGLRLKAPLEVGDGVPVPVGSELIPHAQVKSLSDLPLPGLAFFRLRSFTLGLVTRLRQRYGLEVIDIPCEAVRKSVDALREENFIQAVDDEWSTV